MAASLMVMIPPTVLFLVMQRYFIQGIAMTGLKG
jgi:ABC-type maltose transport system permease subunit